MIRFNESHVRILDEKPRLDYFDMQSADLKQDLSPLAAWNKIMAQPQPFMKLAFKIRDAISSLFGVKRIGGFSGETVAEVKVGDYVDFFLVEFIDEHALVLTERDKHLDVMTSVSIEDQELTITSSVITHNLFGRLYMIPVGIAHRFIVRNMLTKLAKELA